MFKKRNIRGNIRAKVIRRKDDSDSGSGAEEDDEAFSLKKPKVEKSTGQQLVISKSEESLTKNDAATKYDILNQEIIDQERLRKEHRNNDEDKDDGIYRGQAHYTKFLKPKTTMDVKGPKKSASNVRSTTTFDFQRDVCKDFRDTGFCGYGDSCKFMHARDDFKAGWKLNKDWDLGSTLDDKLENEFKNIPFKCPICKKDYKNPIKTNCEHYFCESCFLTRFQKNLPNCFICGKNTNGIAKPAKNLKDLLK
ncbi:hypothetical protein WICMUC_002956 [Wickerhamomyces mucosus]|uniref:Pre-mRNA-splicing factor CWC24 n=1 Tax=Wickerhamomyces mucosus TaxID=1378264 RepID=A0A9P8PMU9_9ASCO|nr:hypothetical protein WICMUC_002956 [Wickerhamomyces mucosus]